MEKKIALLRGINVGGKKKIKMADLRDLLAQQNDLHDIQTYIQSGNIVFSSHLSNEESADQIKNAILDHYGFEVPVVVRSSQQWKEVVDKNHFLHRDPEVEITRLYVTFLSAVPTPDLVEELRKSVEGHDEFYYDHDVIYLHYQTKLSDSKLDNNFIERKLKVSCTTRNWKTTLKLNAMSQN